MKPQTIITISRQFGSGGHEVGELTAQKLAIPFYDKKLIELASKTSGIHQSHFENAEENPPTSFLYSLSMAASAANPFTGYSDFTLSDQIFNAQANAVRKAANEGACVIVGRCATNILKDKSLKIFIHAPFEERVQNVIRRTGREEASARKLVKKMDKERKAYYEYFTDSKWLDMTQYDLCIDSSRFSMEQIVEIVKRCL